MTEYVRLVRWLYALGMTQSQIANYLHKSRTAIRRAVEQAGGAQQIRPAVTDSERWHRANHPSSKAVA